MIVRKNIALTAITMLLGISWNAMSVEKSSHQPDLQQGQCGLKVLHAHALNKAASIGQLRVALQMIEEEDSRQLWEFLKSNLEAEIDVGKTMLMQLTEQPDSKSKIDFASSTVGQELLRLLHKETELSDPHKELPSELLESLGSSGVQLFNSVYQASRDRD